MTNERRIDAYLRDRLFPTPAQMRRIRKNAHK